MYTQPYACAGCMQYSQQPYTPSYTPQYSSSALSHSSSSSIDSLVTEYRGAHKSSAPVAGTPSVQYNPPTFTYEARVQDYFTPQHKEYHATSFLKQYRPATQFIDKAEQIELLVKETFEKTTGNEFPENIIIHILDDEEIKQAHESHNAKWSNTILGFSLNTVPFKQVFVKNAALDQVMAVVGHEIGHVLTPTLPTMHDEEAKAFAFEFAWVDAIVKNKIGNLQNNFTLQPAQNGLHNVAADFVKRLINSGKEVMEIYKEIAKRIVCVEM